MADTLVVAGQPAQHQGDQRSNQQPGDAIQSAGGNFSGMDLPEPTLFIVESFQGRSGTADNQDTSRPKGSI